MIPGHKVFVSIETKTSIADGQGNFDQESWSGYVDKGVLNPMSKNEAVVYSKHTSLPLYTLLLEGKKPDRTERDLTTAQRIRYGARIFNILFVANQMEANLVYKLDLKEETSVN